jgi:hypothetical protein
MRYSLLIIVLFGVLISCNKNKFLTQPQITFTKFSVDTFRRTTFNYPVAFLEVADKEGDIGVGSFLFIKDSTYKKVDSIPFGALTNIVTQKVVFELEYSLVNQLSTRNYNKPRDTVRYAFAIKDNKGNMGEYTLATPLVLIR